MADSQTLFLDRIRALSESLESPSVLSQDLANSQQNAVARLLRNGLAVVGFVALEDYIRRRSGEALDQVSQTGVAFEDLPVKLQAATTYGSLEALQYQLKIIPKEDRIEYIQEQAFQISSTRSQQYTLSPYSLCYSGANITNETIKGALGSFLVRDSWRKMTAISSRIGLTALPLEETFKGAAERRHKAAHAAHANTPHSDIQQFIREALAIAISFDALINQAVKRIKNLGALSQSDTDVNEHQLFKIRRVSFERRVWKEHIEQRSRAIKVEKSCDALLPAARKRASSAGDLLVAFDEDGLVKSWDAF